VPAVVYGSPAVTAPKPSALVVGTSFGWAMVRYAFDSHLFGDIHLDYYNRTLVEWPANIHAEVHPQTKEWNDAFLGKDLYVLDLLEVYLFAPDNYVDEFLAQLAAALAPP